MQAINSPNASFIRDLSMEYVAEGLGDLLEWDTSRGSDFRALTTAVYAMQKWKSLTTSPSLPQLNALLQSNEELEEPFCIKIRQTLAIFVALAKDSRYQAAFHIPNVKKVAPVEFMTTCVLIASFKDKLTMSQLSEAILEMRKDVRGVEQDIRMNGRVVKHMMGFIKGLKSASLKPDPGQPLASNVVRGAGKKRSKIEEEKEEEVSQKKIKLSIPRPKLLSQGVSSTQPLSTTKSSSPAVGSRTKEESSQPLNRQLGSLPRSTQSTASSFRPSFTEVKPTVSDASESLVQTHSKPLLNRLDVIKAAKGNSSGPSFSRTSISSERLESSPIYSADTETQSLGVALIDRISKPAEDSLNHYQQNLVDNSSRHGIESVTRDSSWKGNRKR